MEKETLESILESDREAERIMKFEENLKKKLWIKIEMPGLELKYVWDYKWAPIAWMFIDGDIFKYLNAKWEELLNVDTLRKKKFWYKKALYILGFQLDEENKWWLIYDRDKLDPYTKKPWFNAERIHETTVDYLVLMKNVEFLINRFTVHMLKDAESEKFQKEYSIKHLEKYFNLELLKFKDVDDLEKLWKLSPKAAARLRIDLKKFIKMQCADERYEMTEEEITKEELDWYLKKKYISKTLYRQCLEIVKLREGKKAKTELIKENTITDLSWVRS